MCPCFADHSSANRLVRYAELSRKRLQTHPVLKQAAYLSDFIIIKFCQPVPCPTNDRCVKITKWTHPKIINRVLDILFVSHIFQVTQQIVRLVTINMIDLYSFRWYPIKCQHHQAMNISMHPFVIQA